MEEIFLYSFGLNSETKEQTAIWGGAQERRRSFIIATLFGSRVTLASSFTRSPGTPAWPNNGVGLQSQIKSLGGQSFSWRSSWLSAGRDKCPSGWRSHSDNWHTRQTVPSSQLSSQNTGAVTSHSWAKKSIGFRCGQGLHPQKRAAGDKRDREEWEEKKSSRTW